MFYQYQINHPKHATVIIKCSRTNYVRRIRKCHTIQYKAEEHCHITAEDNKKSSIIIDGALYICVFPGNVLNQKLHNFWNYVGFYTTLHALYKNNTLVLVFLHVVYIQQVLLKENCIFMVL